MGKSSIKAMFGQNEDGFFRSLYEEAYLETFKDVLKKEILSLHGEEIKEVVGEIAGMLSKYFENISAKGNDCGQESSKLIREGKKLVQDKINSFDK